MCDTSGGHQREVISAAPAAAACLAMCKIAWWRVAACWSVRGTSGIGGTGGKTVVVLVVVVG